MLSNLILFANAMIPIEETAVPETKTECVAECQKEEEEIVDNENLLGILACKFPKQK